MTIKARKAESLWQKSKGLIGAKNIQPLLLKTRWGIHTFGVRRPIDILVVDTEEVVIKTKQNLRPNRLFFWNPKYTTIIELPNRFIDKYRIQKGDKLSVILES